MHPYDGCFPQPCIYCRGDGTQSRDESTLYAGVAGGAVTLSLLAEIPYDIDKVVDAIHKRTKDGKGLTILAVAEGAIFQRRCTAYQEAVQGKSCIPQVPIGFL